MAHGLPGPRPLSRVYCAHVQIVHAYGYLPCLRPGSPRPHPLLCCAGMCAAGCDTAQGLALVLSAWEWLMASCCAARQGGADEFLGKTRLVCVCARFEWCNVRLHCRRTPWCTLPAIVPWLWYLQPAALKLGSLCGLLGLHWARATLPPPGHLPWLYDRAFISGAFVYLFLVFIYLQVRGSMMME